MVSIMQKDVNQRTKMFCTNNTYIEGIVIGITEKIIFESRHYVNIIDDLLTRQINYCNKNLLHTYQKK